MDTNDADILNNRLKAVTAFVEQEVNKCLDEREIDVAGNQAQGVEPWRGSGWW